MQFFWMLVQVFRNNQSHLSNCHILRSTDFVFAIAAPKSIVNAQNVILAHGSARLVLIGQAGFVDFDCMAIIAQLETIKYRPLSVILRAANSRLSTDNK
jgi:hypothetical protein